MVPKNAFRKGKAHSNIPRQVSNTAEIWIFPQSKSHFSIFISNPEKLTIIVHYTFAELKLKRTRKKEKSLGYPLCVF